MRNSSRANTSCAWSPCMRRRRPQRHFTPHAAAEGAAGGSGDTSVSLVWSPMSPTTVPLLRRMLLFSAPVTVIVLSEPLLAFTTSLFIGQYASSAELAALGPANVVISFVQYVFASLQIATLGMLSVLFRDNDDVGAQQLLSGSFGLALALGAVACATLWLAPEELVRATGARNPELVSHASAFLRVRAVGQLAVLVSLICQSAFLAQQDPLPPALAALLGTLLSIVGHFALVAGAMQPLLGSGVTLGLTGAAVATTAGNLATTAVLLTAMHWRGRVRPTPAVPSAETVRSLAATMAPLSVTYVSKNFCYMLIQTTATSILDVTRLAAHQAIYAAWAFITFWVAPVEQAILSMVPAASELKQRRATMGVGLLLGVLVGLVGGLTVAAIAAWAPGLLTQDAALWPWMGQVAATTLVTTVLTGIDVSACAVNIAGGDAAYVAQSFALTLLVVGIFMALVRHQGWGFMGIWHGITVFFAVRAVQSGVRAWRCHLQGSAGEPAFS